MTMDRIAAALPQPPDAGARLRRLLRAGHLWLGLTLGLLWALQGLTGAALVFHRELDRAVLPRAAQPQGALPHGERGTPLPLDRLLAIARARGIANPQSIGIIDADPSILSVNYRDRDGKRRGLLLDAGNGRILGNRDWRPVWPAQDSTSRWIYALHHQLLLGETGALLMGISGLFLMVSALWGAVMAWPRRGQWRAVIQWQRWHSRRHKLFGWHRLTGLCAALALILIALTGALVDFGKPLRAFSESWLPYRAPYAGVHAPLSAPRISAQAAVDRAQESLPRGRFVSLALPETPMPAYQIRMRQPGEWRVWSGTSTVTVDPRDGRILDVYDASQAPLANRLLESALAVHNGEAAGLAGRTMVLMAGLLLPVLYVTGLWAWTVKRRRRGRREAQTAKEVLAHQELAIPQPRR